MNLIYIENKELLGKIMTYLKNTNTLTTSLENFDTVIFAEVNNRIIKNIESFKEQGKRIIFLLYLEENKIYIQSKLNNKTSRNYMKKIRHILELSDIVITSLPFFKELFSLDKIKIIEYELPNLNISKQTSDIYKKYDLKRRKKKILIFDFDYHYLDYVEEVIEKYPKLEYIYVGFKPDYLLTLKNQNKVKNLSSKVKFIFYYNLEVITDLIQVSNMILNFEDINLKRSYLYVIFLLKKELLMKQSSFYDNYLINSKNVYTFKTKDGLLKKLNKIEYDRLSNLTDNAYDLIRNCSEEDISQKFAKILK